MSAISSLQRLPVLIVAAALIDEAGRVLVQKRPAGKPLAGLWEFPGGKIEAGETPEQALVRELQEELAIQVETQDLVPLTFATEAFPDRSLILLLYTARRWLGVAQPLAAEALQWCDADALSSLDMPPADVPLVARLIEIL